MIATNSTKEFIKLTTTKIEEKNKEQSNGYVKTRMNY